MKMAWLICGVALLLILNGCADSSAESARTSSLPGAAVYREGHGIELAPAAREFIQLQLADVVASADGRVLVPPEALLRAARGDFVYVANGRYFLRTPVAVGAAMENQVEIVDGLYEGDAIVVSGVRVLALTEVQALNGGVGCADGH